MDIVVILNYINTVKPAHGFIRGVASLERDNLVAFYILGVSEIWPDKRDGLWWKGSYKKGD
jgi:hypothetical protein